MKKKFYLTLLLFLYLCPQVLSQEFDFFDKDSMNTLDKTNRMKPVNEQDYQKVMQKLQELKDKKKQPKRKFWQKKTKKIEGTPLQKGITDNTLPKPYLLLQITQNLENGENIIPQGFYTIGFDHESDSLLLKQGYSIISVIKMRRTPIEPNTDDLYYIKTNTEKEGLKLLYGEIDKHFEAFCRFVK